MKAGADKTADNNIATATQTQQEPFFGKANEGSFFASKKSRNVPVVQAKLSVNEPGDVFEREADRVAEQVVSMPENRTPVQEQISTVSPTQVQREGEEEQLATSQPEIPEWMREGYFLNIARPVWSLSHGPQSPLKPNSTPVLPLRLSPPPPPAWLNDVKPWWQNLPVPYEGLDWGGVNQELALRGALHLRDRMHDSIVAQYQANYLFFKNLGFSEEISVSFANGALPGAVGKSIAPEYPTQSEIFKNSLPKEAFKLPPLPLLNATFGGPPGNRGSLTLLGGVKKWVFRKKSTDADTGIIAPQIVDDTLATNNGQPLDPQTQGFMENRLGMDLSQVRIHNDAQAAESAAAIQAKAYTQGKNIVFGAGEYQPDSESGKRLLAHELAHVGQQNGGVRRKMQTSPENGDAIPVDKIERLLKGRESENEICSEFSKAGDEAIMDAWNSGSLLPYLGKFTASFEESKQFSQHPREIAAIFRALDKSDRYKETRKQRIEGIYAKGPIDSHEAVQILYYIQGMESATLDELFTGENESRYDQFLLALKDEDRDLLKSSVSRFEKRALTGGNKAIDDAVQNAFKDISKILKGEESEINKIWSNRNTRKLKKGKYGGVVLTPQQAIQSYNRLKQLDQGQLEEFIRLYEKLYDEIDSALPVEFRKSAEFGFQKGYDKQRAQGYSDAYMKLYGIAVIYRVLYNYPLSFSNLLSAILSYNKAPAADKALFEEEMNTIISLQTNQLVPIALDFSPVAGEEMTKIVQMLKENVIEMGKPWELYDNQSDVQELAFLKLVRLFKRRVEGESSGKEGPQNSLLEIVNDNADLLDILIKAPLNSENGSKAEKLATDKNYTALFFAAAGLLKALERPDIWEGTTEANSQLSTVLSMLAQSGLADEAWGIVNSRRNDQNSEVLNSHGFTDQGYAPTAEVETGTEVNPIKHWRAFYKMLKGKKRLKVGSYFGEGFLDKDWINWNKSVDLKDFSLLETQKYMGNQIMGLELEDAENETFDADFQKWEHAGLLADISQKPGDFSIQVDEKEGTAKIRAYYLPLKNLNVQISSRAVRAGQGHLGGFVLEMKWPVPGNEEQKEFDLKVLDFELNDLVIVQPKDMYGISRIALKDLHINLNQAVGNYAQMQNWSKLMDRVMEAFYDIFVSLTDAVMVSMQRFMPEMLRDVQDPSKNPENPEVDLTNLVLQEFGPDLNLDINFKKFEIDGLVMSEYGLIGNMAMGDSNLNLKSETTSDERTLRQTLAGHDLEISGAGVSSIKTKNLTSETFGMSSVISEGGIIPGGRQKAVLGNLSNISTGESASRLSKTRRIDFNFSGLKGEDLSIGEKTLSALPFNKVTGFVEFPADTQMRIQVRDIGNLDFLTIPETLPGAPLHIEKTADSEFSGRLDELTVLLSLNSKEEQILHGLEINELTVETLKVGEVYGKKFSVVLTDHTGKVTRLELKEDAKLTGVVASGLHWSKEINPDTGEKGLGLLERGKVSAASTDINQLAIALPGEVAANLDKMTSGEISLNTLVKADGMVYEFAGKNLRATGTVVSAKADGRFDLNAGEISGSYDPLSKFLQLNELKISEILVPELAIRSSMLNLILPKAAAPAALSDIIAAVKIQFNPDENAENYILSIEIDQFDVGQISAFGFQIHSNVNIGDKQEALDVSLPIDKAGIIKGIVVKRFRFDSSEKTNEDLTRRVEWKRSVYDAKDAGSAAKPEDKGGIAGIASINIPEIKGVISNLLKVSGSLETGEISYSETASGQSEIIIESPKMSLNNSENKFLVNGDTGLLLLQEQIEKGIFEASQLGFTIKSNKEKIYFAENPLVKNIRLEYKGGIYEVDARVNGRLTLKEGKSDFTSPKIIYDQNSALSDAWILETPGELEIIRVFAKTDALSLDKKSEKEKMLSEADRKELLLKEWKEKEEAMEEIRRKGDMPDYAPSTEAFESSLKAEREKLLDLQARETTPFDVFDSANGNISIHLLGGKVEVPVVDGYVKIDQLAKDIGLLLDIYLLDVDDAVFGAEMIELAKSINNFLNSYLGIPGFIANTFFGLAIWQRGLISSIAEGRGMSFIRGMIFGFIEDNLVFDTKNDPVRLFAYDLNSMAEPDKNKEMFSINIIENQYYNSVIGTPLFRLIDYQVRKSGKEKKINSVEEFDVVKNEITIENYTYSQLVSEMQSAWETDKSRMGELISLWLPRFMANLIQENSAFQISLEGIEWTKNAEDKLNEILKNQKLGSFATVGYNPAANTKGSVDIEKFNYKELVLKKGVIPGFSYLTENKKIKAVLGDIILNDSNLKSMDEGSEISVGAKILGLRLEFKK